MVRSLTTALALITALLLGACTTVRGAAPIITEERAVSGFSAVEVEGSGTLLITQGDSEALTISGEERILPLITSEVRGDTLVIRPRSSFSHTSELIYRLTVSELEAVTLNGSGDWTATGSADALEVWINGSGSFDAPELASRTARVAISGSGDAIVRVNETLDARISSSGSVHYIGSLAIAQQVDGSGRVTPR
jgi:hypothetical protein